MFRYNYTRSRKIYPVNQPPEWKKHLKDVNMTYSEHLLRASKFSLLFIKGSFKSLIHGIFPGVYQTAATKTIDELEKLKTDI